jgi:glucose-6-phosphate 1-dehydrogenase
MVIFGATGDLTRRKLMPALWDLRSEGCLESVEILGLGRTPMTDDEFREQMRQALVESKKLDEQPE